MRKIHATFAGSIPEYYDRLLVPLIFAPYADDLVRRLKPLDALRVLELACGTGVVTKRVARALGSAARITATDLNEAMLAVARARASDEMPIAWRQADATSLPFENRSFDVVICQFGWMFFPDKKRAMTEARRVLTPGGQLLYNTWDRIAHCPVYAEADAALRACFPNNPPTFYDTPFSLFDVDEHRRLMLAAGFANVQVEVIGYTGARMSAAEIANGVVRGGPAVTEIEERGGDVAQVVDFVARRLEARFGNEPFASPMRALICEATAKS